MRIGFGTFNFLFWDIKEEDKWFYAKFSFNLILRVGLTRYLGILSISHMYIRHIKSIYDLSLSWLWKTQISSSKCLMEYFEWGCNEKALISWNKNLYFPAFALIDNGMETHIDTHEIFPCCAWTTVISFV